MVVLDRLDRLGKPLCPLLLQIDPRGLVGDGRCLERRAGGGDPLEPLSQPSAIFVNGVEQPLTSRPLMLRDRYRQQTPMPPAYRN